jgi:hypothetical protein
MSTTSPAVLAAELLRRDGETPPDGRITREMSFELREGSVNDEARTAELSFSSDAPYQRWFGYEILDHKGASVRLERLNGGAALLMDHNSRDMVGVVEKAWIKGAKGHAIVRFGKSARAEEIWQDVKDGIRKLVSVGYRIHELVLEKEQNGEATYRATDWEPYEISLVAIPADTSVGVGREGEPAGYDPRTLLKTEKEEDMPMTRNDGGAAPAPALAAAPVVATAGAEQRSAAPVAAAPQVNVDDVRRAERERIDSIRAMGERLACADLARTAIDAGTPLEQFIRDYQAKAGGASAISVAESPEIGMSARDQQRYSFTRLLYALSNPNDKRAQEDAAFELECSAEAQRRANKTDQRGQTVPHDVLRAAIGGPDHVRDLTVGTATAGGHTVATDLLSSNFIELLRNSMALEQMGIRRLGDLNGNIAIPRATGGATAY